MRVFIHLPLLLSFSFSILVTLKKTRKVSLPKEIIKKTHREPIIGNGMDFRYPLTEDVNDNQISNMAEHFHSKSILQLLESSSVRLERKAVIATQYLDEIECSKYITNMMKGGLFDSWDFHI